MSESIKSDTTRRTFLTASAAAAVPFFVKADSKTDSKNKILGEGEHQYECIHDWGQLPSNIKYGNTHSVCEDSQGHIYVHHTVYKDSPSPDSVVVFDEKGKFVRSFGPMFRGGAHGMHLSKEGKTGAQWYGPLARGWAARLDSPSIRLAALAHASPTRFCPSRTRVAPIGVTR